MSNSFDLIHLETVDSTSLYLKQFLQNNSIERPLVCLADQQTAGYGQQGKPWITNESSAIFSIAWPLDKQRLLSPLFSLKLAIILHQSLSQLVGETLWVKWPNDLYDAQGKVAGLLIEQVIQPSSRNLILGVGINRGKVVGVSKGYVASGVSEFSTQVLIERLISQLSQTDFAKVMNASDFSYWTKHDLLQPEETVMWVSDQFKKTAVYQGINRQGQAEINIAGEVISLVSGVNSIRKLEGESVYRP